MLGNACLIKKMTNLKMFTTKFLQDISITALKLHERRNQLSSTWKYLVKSYSQEIALEVLTRNHTCVWRNIYNTAGAQYKYFSRQSCDFSLILNLSLIPIPKSRDYKEGPLHSKKRKVLSS